MKTAQRMLSEASSIVKFVRTNSQLVTAIEFAQNLMVNPSSALNELLGCYTFPSYPNSSPPIFHKEFSHQFQYTPPNLKPSPRPMKYYNETTANAAPGSLKTSKLHKQCCQTHTCEPKTHRLQVNFSHRDPFFGTKIRVQSSLKDADEWDYCF